MAVKELTDRISPTFFSFEMITLRGSMSAKEVIGNILVRRVGPAGLPLAIQKILFPFIAAGLACRLHRREKYDAIWAIMANRAGFAALFFKILHPTVPFILTLQEGDERDYPLRRMGILKPILFPYWRQIFATADRITAISNYLAKWAEEFGAAGKITIVPNGVSVKDFQFSASNFEKGGGQPVNLAAVKKQFRKQIGFNEDDAVVVTVSRLERKNGLADLIKAFCFLPVKVKLLIVGVGNLEFELKSLTRRLCLTDRVKFVGFIPRDQLPPFLWAADLFVRPSLSEGLGNAFLEAMAAGLPVIGTRVGGIPDFLVDRENGLFCEVGNPAGLAQVIRVIFEDASLRDKIVYKAQRLVSQKYDWSVIAENFKEILREASNRR